MKLIGGLLIILCSLLVVDKTYKEEYFNERDTLAAIIHAECSNCSITEMYLVGSVVINRVRSHEYPNDLRSVVRQAGQFSGYKSRQYFPTNKTRKIADELLNGFYVTPDIYFFHTRKTQTNMKEITMFAEHHAFGK